MFLNRSLGLFVITLTVSSVYTFKCTKVACDQMENQLAQIYPQWGVTKAKIVDCASSCAAYENDVIQCDYNYLRVGFYICSKVGKDWDEITRPIFLQNMGLAFPGLPGNAIDQLRAIGGK